MFNNLVESKRKKQRSPAGILFSFLLHAGMITLVVYAGGQAAEQFEKPKQEKVKPAAGVSTFSTSKADLKKSMFSGKK